jgi:uncharacterized protein YaaR (DUF327 family)
MRKYDIIPNDSQLNLNKAQKSSMTSLNLLGDSLMRTLTNADDEATIASMLKSIGGIGLKYLNASKTQETKNLFKMSPKEFIKQHINPNMNKTNSQKYLTYNLKQAKTSSERDFGSF